MNKLVAKVIILYRNGTVIQQALQLYYLFLGAFTVTKGNLLSKRVYV